MILIKNGRLIDPFSNRDEILDISIAKDKIEKIGKIAPMSKYETVIDAKGKIVTLGLVGVIVLDDHKNTMQLNKCISKLSEYGFTEIIVNKKIYKDIANENINIHTTSKIYNMREKEISTLLENTKEKYEYLKQLRKNEINLSLHKSTNFEEMKNILPICITKIVRNGHLSLTKMLEKITSEPMNKFDIGQYQLKEGSYANLVIFDASKSYFTNKNEILYGEISYTLNKGKIIYEKAKKNV